MPNRLTVMRNALQMRPVALRSGQRGFNAVETVVDLEKIARRRVPASVFDYVHGAAEGHISLNRAVEAYNKAEFIPRALHDVDEVDLSTNILGRQAKMPLILAPTAFNRLMHHTGEKAVGRAAQRAGVPYALSTMGTTSIENLTRAAPEADLWFQLTLRKDREAAAELLDRAEEAGWNAIMLGVDTPAVGHRRNAARYGMTIPPRLSLGNVLNMAAHPSWWSGFLRDEPLGFESLKSRNGHRLRPVGSLYDPGLTYTDVEWLRGRWNGKLALKGIQSVEDARRAVQVGADAVVLSSHGGRQLELAPAPLELLPEVVQTVGKEIEVFIDSGILNGTQMVAAVGLGATAVMVGRAYLYGLMAAGEEGVSKVLELFRRDAVRTMQLVGAQNLAELNGRVKLRG